MRIHEDCQSYKCMRDLREAKNNMEYPGTEEDYEASYRLFYRQQQIIHCALEHPHALATTGITPHHFDVPYCRFGWQAIDQARELIKPGEAIRDSDFVSFMMELNRHEFSDGAAENFLRAVKGQANASQEYVLRVLVPEIISKHDVGVWESRFTPLCQLVGATEHTLNLARDFRMVSKQVVGEPEPGYVGSSMLEINSEYDLTDKTNRSLVPLGIEQFDEVMGGGHGRGELMVIGGGTSTGKCLKQGTLILMHDGSLKRCDDVVIGDRLMGPDGRPRTVITTNVGEAEMYEVRPTKGDSWYVNIDHILTLASESGESSVDSLFDVPLREWMAWSPSMQKRSVLVRSLPSEQSDLGRHSEACQRSFVRVPFSVVPTGKVDRYYGCTLDGDGRFLLGDFTVTHNSYFAQRLMRQQAKLGQPCLYISVEDSPELMQARFFADYVPDMTPTQVRKKAVDPDQVDRALQGMKEEGCDKVYFLDAKKWTVSQVCSAMRRHRYLFDIDLCIIDYLQAIQPDEPSNSVTNDTALIVASLKKCAHEIGVALVLFSQLSRDEYRNGAEPGLNSCKWAGEIENETEFMVVIWRDEADVLHAKVVKCKWNKATGLRYIVHTSPSTGVVQLPFEDDFEPPHEPAPRQRQRYGSGRGSRSGGNNSGGAA